MSKESSIADVLEEAITAMSVFYRNEDFFSGYGLSEVVATELVNIGTEDGGRDEFQSPNERTAFAKITNIVESTKEAIEALKEIDEFRETSFNSESDFLSQQDEVGVA